MGNEINNLHIEYFVSSVEELQRLAKGRETAVLYGRVSTTHREQETSLTVQRDELFKIAENRDLFVIAIFLEKETGKDDTKRNAYPEMLKTMTKFRPDYLVSKCQDRVNRSVELNARLLSLCSSTGTKLFNYMTGEIIDPESPSDRMKSNITATFDEQYSFAQHKKGVKAHQEKCDRKRLNRNNEMFGYRFNKVTQKMEICEEEAVLIREMFEMYVFKDMGSTSIAKYFASKGVTGRGSNVFISENAILKYLHTTAYIGKMSFNHKGTAFFMGSGGTSKRFDRDQSEYIYADVPAIVDKEIFDLAQKKLAESSKRFKSEHNVTDYASNFAGKHIFASKCFCGSCGSSFLFKYSDRKQEIGSYKCSERKKAVRKTKRNGDLPEFKTEDLLCKNPYKKIREVTLQEIVKNAMDIYSEQIEDIYSRLETAIRQSILERKENDNALSDRKMILQAIKKLEREKSDIEEAFISAKGSILRDSIEKKYEEKIQEIEHYEELLEACESKNENVSNKLQQINKVRSALEKMKDVKTIDQKVVRRFVDRIVIKEDGTVEIIFYFNKTYKVAVSEVERPQFISSVENIHTQGMTEVFQQAIPTARGICLQE